MSDRQLNFTIFLNMLPMGGVPTYIRRDMTHTKVATCCYCGTRAALVLAGQERHELSCASCGAPLHNMKMLTKHSKAEKAKASIPSKSRQSPPYKTRAQKKRKSVKRKLWGELLDVVEDIFD